MYDSDNLVLAIPRMGQGEGGDNAGLGMAVWTYRTDDTDAQIESDIDYVTDAVDKGLKQGDMVLATTDEDTNIGASLYTVDMNADDITAGLLSPASGRH